MAAITSIVSLNQLVTWFEAFADNHFFLKDFGFGEPYDIGTTRQMEFPYMWLTLDDTSVIATGTNVKSAIPDYSFRVFFMDKINIQENYLDQNGFQSDNSQEIISDTIQYLQDLITEIQQNWGQYGVLLSADVTFSPVIDETQDKATGISASITLRTRQVNCVIPEAPTNIIVQPNQPVYETLLTCETLEDCSTFQTYAYTGGTFTGSTLTLKSLNGNTLSVTGFTGGGGSGTSGTSGSSGINGTSGSSGVSGASGSSGVSGTSGSSGISGSAGTSGTSGINGASNSFFNYRAKTNIQTGDPTTEYIIWNNVTQSGATSISISDTDQNGNNVDIFLSNLVSGTTITIQDQSNHTNYQIWLIGTPVDNSTYWTIPITLITSTYSFPNNHQVLFIITTTPSGTSGTSGVNGSNGTSGSSGINGANGTNGSSGITPATYKMDLSVAISDETTQITTGAGKLTIYAPYDFTITEVQASLSTSGSTTSEFDVNINGASIFSTRPTIDANENSTGTASTPSVLSTTSVAKYDRITYDIDTAGSGARGAKIYIVGTRAI
jgi:hypothetical protein